MSHPHSPKPLLLIGSVAAVLALVVGLVGTVRRAGSRARPAPAALGASEGEPARASLPTPEVLSLAEAEVQATPSTGPAPALEPKHGASREERARLAGFVLRPDGEPAAQARVVLGRQHGRCDADGRFELVLTADATGADLIGFEPGFEPALRPAFGSSLRANGENHVRLVLGPETLTLEGTVHDEDGQPLKNWTVELDALDPLATLGLREPVRTDDAGRFVLTDVPAGIHFVRAWKKDARSAVRSAPASAGTTGLTIVAPRAD